MYIGTRELRVPLEILKRAACSCLLFIKVIVRLPIFVLLDINYWQRNRFDFSLMSVERWCEVGCFSSQVSVVHAYHRI
jgi:hypothetical protein